MNTAGFLHTHTRDFRAVVRCLEQPWVRNIPLGLQSKATLVFGALTPRLVDV